jgi:argonaute-like protein implicated in RNA metabolism and viral defense
MLIRKCKDTKLFFINNKIRQKSFIADNKNRKNRSLQTTKIVHHRQQNSIQIVHCRQRNQAKIVHRRQQNSTKLFIANNKNRKNCSLQTTKFAQIVHCKQQISIYSQMLFSEMLHGIAVVRNE